MIELLDPRVETKARPITYVDRPRSLEGKRVALIENTKFNSDKLLVRIGDLLKREYGASEWTLFRKHNSSQVLRISWTISSSDGTDGSIQEFRKTCAVLVAGI